MSDLKVVTISAFFLATVTAGGAGPVPLVSSVTPISITPGSGDFTLTVHGTGFNNGDSKIVWNGAPLSNPTFCTAPSAPNPASCEVTVPKANIAFAGSANVTVINSSSGRTSNALPIEIHVPTPFNAVPDEQVIAATPYLTGVVAIGDFNHDEKQDIAAAGGQYGGPLTIGLGDGTGHFTQSYQANAGSNPTAIAVGDFNHDGNLDVAIANHDSSFLSVFLGDGAGRFTAANSPPVGLNARSIVTGDFNGDGNPDLAIGNVGSPNGGGVQILLGDGKGGFTSGPLYPTAGARLATGDFNSDGKLDLAVTNANNTVNILTGDGSGNFTATFVTPSGQHPIEIHAADFNGDGKLDLAVLNASSGTVSILLGDGLGNFVLAWSPNAGGSPNAFAVGDFNGDGYPDLVVLNGGAYPFEGLYYTLNVLIADGTGNFSASSLLPTDTILPNSVAAADFNSDGQLDFTAGFVYLQAPPGLVNTVTPSSGSGQHQTFTAVYSDGNALTGNKYRFAAGNLVKEAFKINTSPVAPGGCYFVWGDYTPPPNTQCTLDSISFSGSYNAVVVTLTLTFAPTFKGKQNIYLRSFDADKHDTGWQLAGTWTPNP